MSSALSQRDYRALADFRYALRKFLGFSKEYLNKQAGLTPEQYEALLALKAFAGSAGLLVGQLSERLQVKHHTTVSLTDRLVEQGLVTKKRSGEDRRHAYVKLTSAGSALLASLAQPHRRELRGRSDEIVDALKRLSK